MRWLRMRRQLSDEVIISLSLMTVLRMWCNVAVWRNILCCQWLKSTRPMHDFVWYAIMSTRSFQQYSRAAPGTTLHWCNTMQILIHVHCTGQVPLRSFETTANRKLPDVCHGDRRLQRDCRRQESDSWSCMWWHETCAQSSAGRSHTTYLHFFKCNIPIVPYSQHMLRMVKCRRRLCISPPELLSPQSFRDCYQACSMILFRWRMLRF